MLRAEGEEHDNAFAHSDLGQPDDGFGQVAELLSRANDAIGKFIATCIIVIVEGYATR